jgi:tetraacyldisaccharide 4'-kinase
LLTPAAAAYGAIAARRMMAPASVHARIPVIAIGNFVVGGAGKTPTALALAALAARLGTRPVIVSRGYGGRLAGPILVDPGIHAAADVGDEPRLMARRAHSVVVARDRAAGVALAADMGFDLAILDDGFQNPRLAKNLSLVVVDAGYGIGNGLPLPAGPLRAPFGVQLARADMLVLIGAGLEPVPFGSKRSERKGPAQAIKSGAIPYRSADTIRSGNALLGDAVMEAAWAHGKPVVTAQLAPSPESVARLAGQPVVAYAGIGRPAKVAATLDAIGADIRRFEAFADHHVFTPADARRLIALADEFGANLVTTEKDYARLDAAASNLTGELARRSSVLAVDLSFADEQSILKAIERLI